jgi:hypothetical protein
MKTKKAPIVRVRRSTVHGLGVFATRRIGKGKRIIEYLGERIGHKEANRRYALKNADDNHTFLFVVDRNVVIDAGTHGNEARYINHGCDANCESVIENRRVYIDALRTIKPGEELKYDYAIGRDRDDPPNIDEVFACHCGAEECRGTMLWPAKRPKRRQRRMPGPPASTSSDRGVGSSAPQMAQRS